MKNKTVGFMVILFLFWLFAKNDKTQTSNATPLSKPNPPSTLTSHNSTSNILTDEKSKAYYINADTLKVRNAPNGNTIQSLKRGAQVRVYEQISSWSRISKDQEEERWVSASYLCETSECYIKRAPSQPTPIPKQQRIEQPRTPRHQQPQNYSSSCSCSSGNVCIGPRGGRYCITSGGNKRYGV
ncbi:SH3 domain-containing protein [Serratia sp. 14-2641]|uniref:SH3 domain-containing protein n=1 Tax=Serratia sp. 14-2641 TaxID=1841657 RepID=UPI00094583A8|nr:SH3 domain-containing protein [Serratia sp. 14-2641]